MGESFAWSCEVWKCLGQGPLPVCSAVVLPNKRTAEKLKKVWGNIPGTNLVTGGGNVK